MSALVLVMLLSLGAEVCAASAREPLPVGETGGSKWKGEKTRGGSPILAGAKATKNGDTGF